MSVLIACLLGSALVALKVWDFVAPRPALSKKIQHVVLLVLGLVVCAIAIQILTPLYDKFLGPPAHRTQAAYNACEHYMADKLDTPATAQFAGRFSRDTTITPVQPAFAQRIAPSAKGGVRLVTVGDTEYEFPVTMSNAEIGSALKRKLGGYEVASFVDAHNTFGAKVRTRFRCVVQWDAKEESWSLVDLRTALWSEPPP
jgi:hypothetical protein